MANYLDKSGLLRVLQGVKNQIERKVGELEATKGTPNGIASLDNKGFLPLTQLGNLDTTFFEAVQELPTNNIKKHIYLIKNTKEGEQDTYDEYLYTGDVNGQYDASKWEKLGDFVPTFDLKEYAKKSEGIITLKTLQTEEDGCKVVLDMADGSSKETEIPVASASPFEGPLSDRNSKPPINWIYYKNGLMSGEDKYKLDGIEDGATRIIVDDSLNAASTNPVQNKIISEALNKKANTDVVTTSANGLMSNDDKAKIDYIFGIDNYAKKILTTNFVNAIQFCHCDNSAWTTTNDYDVIVGNRPDGIAISNDFANDGYIEIDSTKSANSFGGFKQGNMYIIIPNDTGSINLGRGVNETKASAIALARTGNINITQNYKPSTSNIQLNGTNIQLTQSNDKANAVLGRYAGTNVNINEYQFSINNRKDGQKEKYFYIDHSGDLTNLPNKDADKIQFFTDDLGVQSIPLQIKKNEIKCWGDQISSTKGKDIRLKTSSSNSVRLTEGEGFKVFANLFAEPDHATDITEFTDEEKAMLKNNSVQRLLIMILKKLNLIEVQDPNT